MANWYKNYITHRNLTTEIGTVPLGYKKVWKHVPSEIIAFSIVKLSAEDSHVIFEFILGADFELQPQNGQI